MAKDRYTEERNRQEEAKKRNTERKEERVDPTVVDPIDDESNDSVNSEGIFEDYKEPYGSGVSPEVSG